jgi:hypothetical protein
MFNVDFIFIFDHKLEHVNLSFTVMRKYDSCKIKFFVFISYH